MRKFLFLAILIWSTKAVKADMISLIRADQCESISEIFIDEDHIRVTLEIGEKDYKHFLYIVPEAYVSGGFNDGNRSASLQKFFHEQFVLTADGKVLNGEVKTLKEIPRNYRASLYTGKVDTTNLTISSKTLFVEIIYTVNRPKILSITPPIVKDYKSTRANIGFVTYHKDLPVNDLRYLGQKETVHLNWNDPWYSIFENPNIARHHKYSLMSFLYVDPYEVRHEVLVRLKDLEDWIKLNYSINDFIRIDELDSIKKYVAEYLIEKNRVHIDGIEFDPILDKAHFVKVALSGIQILEIPEDMPYSSSIIGVIFAYPHDSIPQQVTVNWDMWSDRIDRIPCVMSDPAGPLPYDLTPDDTQLIWNNYLKNYKLPTVSEIEVTNASVQIPIVTVIMLLIIGTMVFRKIKGKSHKWNWGTLFLLLLVGGIGWFFQNTLELPFLQKTSFSTPQSKQLISELLRNTYRAFDFREEEDVYDKLAISNDGLLLSDVYIQTKKSMILENQGGIQVKLKGIELSEAIEVESTGDELAYQCSWTVEGDVGHWGHIHKRINQYQAIIRIKPVEGVWKMVGLEVLDESRLL